MSERIPDEVKRWNWDGQRRDDGQLVKFSDYEALRASNDVSKGEIAGLNIQIEALRARTDEWEAECQYKLGRIAALEAECERHEEQFRDLVAENRAKFARLKAADELAEAVEEEGRAEGLNPSLDAALTTYREANNV